MRKVSVKCHTIVYFLFFFERTVSSKIHTTILLARKESVSPVPFSPFLWLRGSFLTSPFSLAFFNRFFLRKGILPACPSASWHTDPLPEQLCKHYFALNTAYVVKKYAAVTKYV